MKIMKLSEFAILQSGLVLNRKEARFEEEMAVCYKRLNLRSLNKYGVINREELDFFPSKSVLDASLLTQPDDVVVKLFMPIFPTLITEKDSNLVIPSQLVVIRIFDKQVLPKYLQYYLSTTKVSELMLTTEGWQSQRTIKVSTFADLKIPIPPIEKQRLIAEISATNLKRELLYKELVKEQSRLTALEIQRYIGGK